MGLEGLAGRLEKVEEKREKIGWADEVDQAVSIPETTQEYPLNRCSRYMFSALQVSIASSSQSPLLHRRLWLHHTRILRHLPGDHLAFLLRSAQRKEGVSMKRKRRTRKRARKRTTIRKRTRTRTILPPLRK